MADNTAQVDYWNGAAGDAWAAQQVRMDRQLDPLGHAAIAALAPTAGETILDIGCGGGATTAQLAERGAVPTGVDVSQPLLARARARFPALAFVHADAATHELAPATGLFDAAFSRFGVMFFADPVAAFAHVRAAVKPGGRLAFVCWRPARDNPLFTVPTQAAESVGVAMPPPPANPHEPGPFAFADRARCEQVLGDAGWRDIAVAPHDEPIGGNSLADAVLLALEIGPLGRLLREQPQHRERAIPAVRDAFARHVVGGVVMLPSATWIVRARA